jgi:diguanylate cyclase (GGDEF)-like protein
MTISRAVRLVQVLLVACVAAYLVSLLTRDSAGYDVRYEGVLTTVALFLCPILCWWRAIVVRTDRLAFGLLGAGTLMFAVGNVAFVLQLHFLDEMPYPSVADIGYFGVYPFFVAGVLVLARGEVVARRIGIWIDGLIGMLGLCAVGSALVLHTTLRDLSGNTLTIVVGAAYPLADVLLIGMIIGILTLRNRQPGRRWLVISAGLVVFACADIAYLLRLANDSYVPGTLLDGAWVVGLAVLSLSAWQPTPSERPAQHQPGVGSLVVPIVFGLAAIAVMIMDRYIQMPWYASAFAVATLFAGMARAGVSVHQERRVIELRHQAGTDDLTDLPNRRAFSTVLDATLATSSADDQFGVLLLDLDRFKEVNDLLGHQTGDRLLREIGPRLAPLLRANDHLSRLGGDEFGVILPGIDTDGAMKLGNRLRTALMQPFLLDNGITQQIGASVGIALWPNHATDAESLFQCADVAMYSAKRSGVGVVMYDPEHGADGRKRLRMAKELRAALDEDQFVLHYQPKFELQSNTVVGVEALVRWQHPKVGAVAPDVFLPLVEQMGCMPELTELVLAKAISQLSVWRMDGKDLTVAVNLSATGLSDDRLVARIAVLLASAGVPAAALTLEITESMLLFDRERATATLEKINALGVTLSVDDYGTGFSSLTYLRDLPVQELKIDRTFVNSLSAWGSDAAIVRSTIDLAHALGMSVVAEGVERPETLELLALYGCDLAQGFHLCVPLAGPELTAWLRDRRVGVLGAFDPTGTQCTPVAIATQSEPQDVRPLVRRY